MVKRKKRLRVAGRIFFAIYIALAVYFLFFSDSFDRTMVSDNWRYNLQPFAEIRRFWDCRDLLGTRTFIVNVIGNIVCFMPFGFLLPVMTKIKLFHKGYVVVLCSLWFSTGIEVLQMIGRVGAFDVDDIILNTIGGLLGFLLMKITLHTYKKLLS